MLKIEDLTVEVNGKTLLHDVNLEVKKGYTNVLFGPNGAGKTALMRTIMGFSEYKVVKGQDSVQWTKTLLICQWMNEPVADLGL